VRLFLIWKVLVTISVSSAPHFRRTQIRAPPA